MKKYLLTISALLVLSLLTGCMAPLHTPAEHSIGAVNPAREAPAEANASPAAEPQRLSRDQAKNAALAHAEVAADAVRDLDIELDRDFGTTYYEISFESGGLEYDYEIEAYTGEILRSRSEPDR